MTDQQEVLDEAVVAELRESVGGDDTFVAELASAYLAEGQEQIEAMVDAMGRGDVAAVVRPAHSLKSSSASLGAARVAELCRQIEYAAREGRTEGLAAAVGEVEATWHLTVAAIKERGLAG